MNGRVGHDSALRYLIAVSLCCLVVGLGLAGPARAAGSIAINEWTMRDEAESAVVSPDRIRIDLEKWRDFVPVIESRSLPLVEYGVLGLAWGRASAWSDSVMAARGKAGNELWFTAGQDSLTAAVAFRLLESWQTRQVGAALVSSSPAPQEPTALFEYARGLVALREELNRALEGREGALASAESICARLLDLAPRVGAPAGQAARLAHLRWLLHLQDGLRKGDASAAGEALTGLRRIREADASLLCDRGVLALAEGDGAAAVEDLKAARAAGAEGLDLLIDLARAARLSGQKEIMEEALAAARLVIESAGTSDSTRLIQRLRLRLEFGASPTGP